MDGKRGNVVFEAFHRDPEARIFWHLDEDYIGETSLQHRKALDVAPGTHTITLTDLAGGVVERKFEVLDRKAD
jgi:penicillin-binding protein 1C